MRLKWIGSIILFIFFVLACASDSTGPRFKNLRASKQQQIQQELLTNWSQYIIYFIPQRAVLFDLKDDPNTLLVSSSWIRAENKNDWPEILQEYTQTSDDIIDVFLGATTGFQEIIGPDEQFFGYLVHQKLDLVSLRIMDRNTMRIYYSPSRTSGP